MTYNEPEPTIIEKLAVIRQTLEKQNYAIHELQSQIADLDQAGTCTGVVHWRDKNGNRKMYANHSVGESCPIHGEPKAGKRLRTYVGADPVKQDQVLAAIKRHAQTATLDQQIRTIRNQKSRIESAITCAWRHATRNQRWE